MRATGVFVFVAMVTGAFGQTVRFINQSVVTSEGEQFTVTVQLLGSITQTVLVIVEVEGDVKGDFIGNTQVVTFSPSSATAYAKFTVRDDDEAEIEETFQLRILLVDDRVSLGTPSFIPVLVNASDATYGIFGFVNTTEATDEELFTSVVNVVVQRTVCFFNTITVTYEVNGTSPTAKVGTDVAPRTGRVAFQPNQKVVILQLRVLPDSEPEDDEIFVVRLTSATFNAGINVSELKLTVRANDAPVRFSKNTYILVEGPQTAAVTMGVHRGINADGARLGSLGFPVTVLYRFESGTAISGQDFSSTDGELIFKPGETTKQIPFSVKDDTAQERVETFRIRLMSVNDTKRATLVTPSVVNIIIIDGDSPNGVISFERTSNTGDEILKTVNEDRNTSVTFRVLRTQGTTGQVSVTWRVERVGGNTDPVDQDVGPQDGTLGFADGEDRKLMELTIKQDSVPETSEQFNITLVSATGGADVQGINTALLTIEDSDNAYGTVEFAPDGSHAINTPGDPRNVQLLVTRAGGRLGKLLVNVSVSYVFDGVTADNILEWHEATATMDVQQPRMFVRFNILRTAFLGVGGRFIAVLGGISLSMDGVTPYGVFHPPTLGTRRRAVVPVAESETDHQTGFSKLEPITVEEPVMGNLQEGTQPITVVVESTGNALTHRQVQFVVEPDNGSDFYGAPMVLMFEPGVTNRTAIILAKKETHGEKELTESFQLRLLPLRNASLGIRNSINISVIGDACGPNPCENNGTCVTIATDKNGFKCLCPPDFQTMTCTKMAGLTETSNAGFVGGIVGGIVGGVVLLALCAVVVVYVKRKTPIVDDCWQATRRRITMHSANETNAPNITGARGQKSAEGVNVEAGSPPSGDANTSDEVSDTSIDSATDA